MDWGFRWGRRELPRNLGVTCAGLGGVTCAGLGGVTCCGHGDRHGIVPPLMHGIVPPLMHGIVPPFMHGIVPPLMHGIVLALQWWFSWSVASVIGVFCGARFSWRCSLLAPEWSSGRELGAWVFLLVAAPLRSIRFVFSDSVVRCPGTRHVACWTFSGSRFPAGAFCENVRTGGWT